MAGKKTVDNERWLSDGDCSKCRRSKFCSKQCKPAKLKERAEVANAIAGEVKAILQENGIEPTENVVGKYASGLAKDDNLRKNVLNKKKEDTENTKDKQTK